MGDDYDDDASESSSALPWVWVIEALASFKEITIPTLQGFIDEAPVGPDEFSENTKELFALRCLEELYASSAQGNNLDASSLPALDSRVGLDFSRTCEDVLQEIMAEVPSSNVKMAGAELLKWDVYPFILHKRASKVKCHLEKLKESILEGTLPLSDDLKERSGLFRRHRDHTVHVNDGECGDSSDKDDGNSTHAEDMGVKENSVSLILEGGNKSSKDHLPGNDLLSSKRARVHSDDEHFMRYLHEKPGCVNECDDLLRNKKRSKCSASPNFDSNKGKPISQLGKEVSENSTEKNLLTLEKGGHCTEKNNRATLSDGYLEDRHNRCTASIFCQSSSNNEVFHDESDIPFNATLMPQHTIGCEKSQEQQAKSIVSLAYEIQQKTYGIKPLSKHDADLQHLNVSEKIVCSNKAQDDTGNGFGVEILGDTIAYRGEKISPIMKKHAEENLDMKSHEIDQLLVCEATAAPAPLLILESCLGTSTKIYYTQHNSGAEPCHNTSMDETNATVHVESIPTNDGNANKIQQMTNESQPKQKEPNIASLNASRKSVANDKGVVDTVSGCGAELSSDSEGYHNEKIDLVAKKDEFLSSQYSFGRDLSAMTESTEQNLCMKCNEAGQLLVCKTTTCSLMVHKNCLGASAQLNEKGKFFCPFCAYSHAISEYLQAKKKASLARKELSVFISKGIRKQATEHVHEFGGQENSLSRKSYKFDHIHLEKSRIDPLKVNEENREDCVGEHGNEVNNFHFGRSRQQSHISVVHSSCGKKENLNNESADDVREENEGKILNAKSLTRGRVEDKEVPTDHVGEHGNDKFSAEKANIVPASKRNAGKKASQNMAEHNMDGTVEPISADETGKEEIFEDECKKHIISRYSKRSHKHEIQYKTQTSPPSRRKATSWTAEEEELIKEGVQKFGSDDSQIPWKKILAFGSHLFQKDDRRRTPYDLKDKWKNMCKAHSKLRQKASS